MAVKKKKKDSRLTRAKVAGYNKPKRTPGHAKNIAKGKMSAAYWADKVKW